MKLDMFCDTKRLIRGQTEYALQKLKLNETHQKNVVLNTLSLEFLCKICKFFSHGFFELNLLSTVQPEIKYF